MEGQVFDFDAQKQRHEARITKAARADAFKEVANWLSARPVRSRVWRAIMPEDIQALEHGELPEVKP